MSVRCLHGYRIHAERIRSLLYPELCRTPGQQNVHVGIRVAPVFTTRGSLHLRHEYKVRNFNVDFIIMFYVLMSLFIMFLVLSALIL
jgi:hypothetical protein